MVSITLYGISPEWDLSKVGPCSNDQGKYLQMLMTLIVMITIFKTLQGFSSVLMPAVVFQWGCCLGLPFEYLPFIDEHIVT